MSTFYEGPDAYSVDARGLADSLAYSTLKHLGAASSYLMAAKDRDGRALDGASNYWLRVPANAPVKQYWSATLYDRVSHALIRDVPRPSRSSQSPGLQKNPDGSVDVYFGPTAPAGKESNWVPDDRLAVSLRCCSGFTVLRMRSSRRRGRCPTSRRHKDHKKESRRSEKTNCGTMRSSVCAGSVFSRRHHTRAQAQSSDKLTADGGSRAGHGIP